MGSPEPVRVTLGDRPQTRRVAALAPALVGANHDVEVDVAPAGSVEWLQRSASCGTPNWAGSPPVNPAVPSASGPVPGLVTENRCVEALPTLVGAVAVRRRGPDAESRGGPGPVTVISSGLPASSANRSLVLLPPVPTGVKTTSMVHEAAIAIVRPLQRSEPAGISKSPVSPVANATAPIVSVAEPGLLTVNV